MAITNPTDPLKCYCGRQTYIYDCVFKRNFCSNECAESLVIFLGGYPKVREILAGDFRIQGSTVVLSDTLIKHQTAKIASIDRIDAQIRAQTVQDKEREALRKIGLPEATIEAMLKAKG